ncbi:MAG: hypothetical protein ACP5RH_13185 [Leptodesmis sp.]|nr:hypothetical protein [Leptodesmis sichuanensis]
MLVSIMQGKICDRHPPPMRSPILQLGEARCENFKRTIVTPKPD